MFYVGQKVVCVDDTNKHPWLFPDPPIKKGIVYIIEAIIVHPVDGRLAVSLVGIENTAPSVGFIIERFRPIVERKTDISIFESLLDPTTKILETTER